MISNRLVFLLVLVLSSIGNHSFGQNPDLSNLRTQTIELQPSQKTYPLDSLTIIPASLKVFDATTRSPIDSIQYQLVANELQLSSPIFFTTQRISELSVSYRVLPYNLSASYAHLDTTEMGLKENNDYIGFTINPFQANDNIINFKGLDYTGSFSRGISFGNSQNLVLNSSFNLQLAGELGDDIEILAAITDNNIPLQPEGNTQQLQEFDKIFIQLSKKENVLIAGDYELNRPDSYFMNYYKKLQGATFRNVLKPFEGSTLQSRASVAIARGKFARNTLATQEGNQGPYRLSGNQGETFIIALAGTEKVYFDGQLLTRGLEGDYFIDYNRADIEFTNKRLITKDSRIIVEFEYADQQYLRSMYAFDTEFKHKKWRLHFNLFSEQDSRSSGGLQDLDSLQQNVLAQAGDDVNNALAPSLNPIEEFNEFRIHYKMRDTVNIENGVSVDYQVLVYTTNPDSAQFTATFTNVGPGLGNYILNPNNSQNGRVFQWIAPDAAGNPQGSFEPVVRLVAPNQRQMYAFGADYEIHKNAKVETEIALSRNDANRFSDIGDQDDAGVAVFTRYDHLIPLKKQWNIATEVSYEFTQDRFQALNPYRPAEFTRDWNLANNQNQLLVTDRQNEHLARAGVSLNKTGLGSLKYQFSSFLRGDLYTGMRHFTRATATKKGFAVDAQLNWLTVDSEQENSDFFRPKINLSKTFAKLGDLKIGAYGEQEKNQRFTGMADTLSPTSFYYDTYRIYLETPADKKITFGANYTQRLDYAPVGKAFSQNTEADEFNLNGSWTPSKVSRLSWNFTYRQLKIIDDQLTNLDPLNSSLGRLDHQLNLFKGAVRSTTNYEIGSGQEPRIAYNYLPVNQGDGVYFWDETLDFNGDGVPQVNEIREEAYDGEGNIIRVTLFTDEFIRTNNVTINESLQINLRSLFRQAKGVKKILGKLSTQSTMRMVRRTRQADGVSPYNPFQTNIPDTALVSINANIRNVLFFNRGDQKYDVQLGQSIAQNKIVLVSGFQFRRNDEQFLRSRWNISRKVSSQLELSRGTNESDSEFFDNQDFEIRFISLLPKLTLQPSNNFRSIFSYEYKRSENQSPLKERSLKHDFKLETTFNRSTTTSIRLDLSFVNIDYNGARNTPLEFAILETLKDGKNYLWSLSLDRRISKNVLMSVSYEGRKTGISNTVHVGRAQVRATF